LVYDASTEQWHDRSTRDDKTGVMGIWQPLFATYAFNKIIVGNVNFACLMELDFYTYTDYDPTIPSKAKPISRIIQGPVYFSDLRLVRHFAFLIDIVAGHGPLNNQGSNPTAMLQYSNDSGNTWSNIINTQIGRTGMYANRCRWLNLGQARNRVYRVIFTENMQFMCGNARLESQVGANP